MEVSKLSGELEILIDYSDIPTVTLRGEVDYRNMHKVREAIRSLAQRGKASINVDLEGLIFMDSTGVSALVDAANSVVPMGGEVTLRSPSAQVVRMLERCGFGNLIHLGRSIPAKMPQECTIHHDTAYILDFEVPSRPEMIAHVRARVAGFACNLPLSEEDIEDIKLAVGEASSNAIRHGRGLHDTPMAVKVESKDAAIHISIRDNGYGFDPDTVKMPEPGELTLGGRGIMFMRALMDEVHFRFENPGTRVELVKRFRMNIS